MRYDMKRWIAACISNPKKKAMPVLSFPGVQLIGYTVEEMVKKGELQAQCMKAVADRFDTGAVFSLMDLSVEAEAFGSSIHYSANEVPTVQGRLVRDEEEADALEVPKVGMGRTGECVKGIQMANELIADRPVLAGMIGPYSLAGRLLDMTEIMVLCYEEPEMVETVLKKAASFLVEYAKAFKAAGANGICIAEPAAGLLSPALLDEFSSPYVHKIREAVEDDSFIVMYHNCGNIIPLLENIKAIGACAYSFGNAIDMEEALKAMPSDSLVIGNIDPAGTIRNGSPDKVYKETMELMERCGKYPNFVPSSGCDIPAVSSLQNIQAFFDAVNQYYLK